MIEEIKVGQKWLTRNGQTAEILAIDEGTWPIYVKVNDYQYYYGIKGNFSDAGSENERDLVTLIVEELEMKTIEVGQEWLTRGGLNMTILSIDETNTSYPVWAKVTDGESHFSYTLGGKYYADDGADNDDDLDQLIEEAVVESVIVPSLKPAPSVFKVGQKWKTRDGSVATLTSVDERNSLNYPILADMENSFTGTLMVNSYTIGGYYYSNNFDSEHAFDLMELIVEDYVEMVEEVMNEPMEVLVDLVTQLYEETVKEEDDFVNQEHIWTHLLSDGLIQSKDNKQVFGFDNGYIRVFTEKDKAEAFVSTLNFTLMDRWTKYTFPEKEVWKPHKPTLCWVTDSEIANPRYEVEFISDYDEELYINTDEGRTWKYAIPLTIDEVAVYLDECE